MAHKKSSSVANIRAMFEKDKSVKEENKPRRKVRVKKHSTSDFWENVFKTKQQELIKGPAKIHKEWEHQEKKYESKQLSCGKIGAWNPQNNFTKKEREVGKLSLSTEFTEQLTSSHEKSKAPEKPQEDANKMMTCAPDEVVPPETPLQPAKNARAYFSDYLVGPDLCLPYAENDLSDYVGAGAYPKNREAFPNASRGTFDGIAIDGSTRVILWEKENFEGKVLLDMTGPVLINNVQYKTSNYQSLTTNTFRNPELEKNYPPSVRIWTETNMNLWTAGSVKIVAATK